MSDEERWVRFGPAFACCPMARALIISCALVLCGTSSMIALESGLLDHLPSFHREMHDWMNIGCGVTFALALLLGLVGSVSIFIHGLNRSGEVVIRGSRYRGMAVSKVALSIFTLPWIVLLVMILFLGFR